MATIQIDIDVRNNTLVVGANGGNARAPAGTKILWVSKNVAFTLEFFQLAVEAQKPTDVRELKRWPFSEREPPNGVEGPTREFLGTLSEGVRGAQFKYYVTVENLRLDPIIIVDK